MKALLASLLLVSCAHTAQARFADDSASRKTLWLCRPDAKNSGDLECVDFESVLKARQQAAPDSNTSEM